MKKILLVTAALMLARVALPQGQITFDNFANQFGNPGEFPGAVTAWIYNVDPANPGVYKSGNIAAGFPTSGTQTYGGARLANDSTHNYTVTLWARNATTATGTADLGQNNLNLVGTTTMRTTTGTGNNAGRVLAPAANPVVADVTDASQRATFQVRVWDSRGGTILTWDQALQTPGVALGYSQLFTVPYALGGFGSPPSTAPNMEGLQSFQLFIVPEPSVIALGVLGAGCLFLLRRRK